MDGEFICEEYAYQTKGIGGGNFLILGKNIESVLNAAELAVSKINQLKNVILPFPGGIVRTGSKVGSKYKNLIASTNFDFCPGLKGLVSSKLNNCVNCVLEIVIDGLSENDIKNAMMVGIKAILDTNNEEIYSISAGNYGGKLGPYLFKLKEVINA